MALYQIDTDRPSAVREFLRLPFQLYRQSPYWVPPILHSARLALDRRRHPFECIDDTGVSRQLFGAAGEWAHGRGLETLIGPRGLLRTDGMGLLVEGFEHISRLGRPYNFPYYERLVKDSGFVKEQDYLSGHLTRSYVLPERFLRFADRAKARGGFAVHNFRKVRELRRILPRVFDIYNEAFTEVWGYYPSTEAELAYVSESFLPIVDPRLIKVVMKDGEIAGFMLAFPEVSAAIRRTGGRIWPLGWIDIRGERKRTEWVAFSAFGFLPKYQGVGANAVLYAEVFESIMGYDYQHGDFGQVAETNFKSLGEFQALGMNWYKRHRIYRREV